MRLYSVLSTIVDQLQAAEDEAGARRLVGLTRVIRFHRQRLASMAIRLRGGAS